MLSSMIGTICSEIPVQGIWVMSLFCLHHDVRPVEEAENVAGSVVEHAESFILFMHLGKLTHGFSFD